MARPHVPDPATEPYVGVRGASRAKAAGLEVHFKRGGVEAGVEPATVLHAGDSLRFVVRGERARYVEVRLRDGGGGRGDGVPGGRRRDARWFSRAKRCRSARCWARAGRGWS